MIGRTFARYRITAVLGVGGCGTVYRADDREGGVPVALKIPHPGLVGDASGRAEFLDLAHRAARLTHPHIVAVHDVCDEDGEIFMVMELIEGHSLRTRLMGGPVPLRDTLTIARAVADALTHAHAHGVLHLDLKPDNVMLAARRTVKVADFGMPRVAPGSTRGETSLGMLNGTPAYLAPEVVREEDVSAATDLYGLGVLLYEMTAGAPPFPDDSVLEALSRVVRDPPPPLPAAAPGGLQALVERLLAKHPEDRPCGAAEVAGLLLGMGAAPR